MKEKKLNLYAYTINPTDTTDAPQDFVKLLGEAVSEVSTIQERMLRLNESDSEYDCILNMEDVEGDMFGLFARLTHGNNIGIVPEEILQSKYANAEKLMIGDENIINHKRLTYFYVSSKYVILNYHLSSSFQVYFNSLTNRVKTGAYNIRPLNTLPKEVNLADISKIKIADTFSINLDSKQQTFKKILQLPKVLKDFLNDANLAGELADSNIVSAEVHLVLKKPKEMSKEDYSRITSNMLTLGDEAMTVIDKNNRTIKGGEMRKQKSVKVEILESGLINEQHLKSEMVNFAKDLEDEAD